MPVVRDVRERLNYYGFSGLIVALLSTAALIILEKKDCLIEDYGKLRAIQIASIVCGALIFLLGFFNIAGRLYEIKAIFISAVVAILVVGGIQFWGVYIAFAKPCFTLDQVFESKNAFQAEDRSNIAIFFIDIIAGLTLLSIGFTFAKRL